MAGWLRVGCACAALAAIACEPSAPADVAAAPQPGVAVDSLVEELPPSVQEQIAPELPAAPPVPERQAKKPLAEATRPKAAPTAAAAAVAAARATSDQPEHPPLDILLRQPLSTPPEQSSTIDLSPGAPAPAPSGSSDPGALERWKEHVRLDRRSEPVGPAGPRQGTVSETEAALRIPVDDSVSLEGGVRVDSREDPSAKEPVRRSPPTPRVGVEVKF